MRTDDPFLSRFLSKLLEIVGAGLASAAGAFLLGQIAKPSTPPPVVQIVRADADTIRMVRGDPMLVDEVRNDLSDASKAAVQAVPATASVKIEKAAKAAKVSPARREHKAEPVPMESARVVTGADARWPELPVRIAPASQSVAQQPAPVPSPVREATEMSPPLPKPEQATSTGGFRLFAALRQIPAWFLPNPEMARDDAPRPPLPVGQFWQSTM